MKVLFALEDGFVLEGESFTGSIELAGGEVVFQTAMVGYQELITDPACSGQMLCLTWPLIGNYGVNDEDMMSEKAHPAALLVKECCKEPSNWRSAESLPDFLRRQGVAGVEGLDTRALTVHLRQNGTMRGAVSSVILDPRALVEEARKMPCPAPLSGSATPRFWDAATARLVPAMPADGSFCWPDTKKPRVLVYDFGVRRDTLRALSDSGLDLLVVPPSFGPEQAHALKPHGIFLSGGPGDPTRQNTDSIRLLVENCPAAGIGLGCELLALALGGRVEKLKFGRHGVNHPVKNLTTNRVEISAQYTGFDILPGDELVATHINLNDETVAGFRHKTKPIMGILHDPQGASGPSGDSFLAAFRAMLR